MPRRGGRPGLLGTMARTTIIAGTATAVAGGMNRRSQEAAANQQQAAAAQQQAIVDQAAAQAAAQVAAQQAPAIAPLSTDEKISKLKELGQLKDSGVLTEAEFTAEKAKVLAG